MGRYTTHQNAGKQLTLRTSHTCLTAERMFSPNTSHVCAVTRRTQPCFSCRSIARNNSPVKWAVLLFARGTQIMTRVEDEMTTLSAEPSHLLEWHYYGAYSASSRWFVCSLWLRKAYPIHPRYSPDLSPCDFLSQPLDEGAATWHSLPYRSRNSAGCRTFHLKDQQNKCYQRYSSGSRMPATCAIQRWLLLWKAIKVSPVPLLHILYTHNWYC